MAFPTLAVTPGAGQTINTLPNAGQAKMADSLPVSPPSDLADIEPAGVPITGVAMPAGGVGIKGWLSGIFGRLAGLPASLGAKTSAASTSVVMASDQAPLSVLGRTSGVTVTPALTANSAYVAGNVVGGVLTFANAFDAALSGILQSIRVKSLSTQTTGLKLYLFRSAPATVFTDKTAPAIVAADIPALIGVFPLTTVDSGLGTMGLWELDGVAAAMVSGSTSLYGVLVCTGTPTFASVSDLTVSVIVLKD